MDTQTQINDPKIDAMRDLFDALDGKLSNRDHSLDRVQLLRMISETALSALRQAVPEATRAGASWSQIGKSLGISKQGAWEQYR